MIGFEKTLYTVDEFEGQAVVGVAILDGSLSQDVVVRVNTEDGTAISTST